ncbi:membrane dipeptidase [Bacillus lacus]|uniref:Membrane dipeptidase n=1 Tax=Metabacillus lacus TaxID=1983721 RepID=A0A7X2LWX2_9BACI|nr:dipeptidase [Metabacillus lacus]MRX70671.1 membrane dipeptidase [Metabacillus lacus]
MKIFDAHCDLLYKLWKYPGMDEYGDPFLQTSIQKLQNSSFGIIQCFAVFVPSELSGSEKLIAALSQINLFHEVILKKYDRFVHIKSKEDIEGMKDGEIGAILTLEGCDCLQGNINLLETFYHLGVRSFGLTWNNGNLLADGALESRNAGLSSLGVEAVRKLNMLKVWTDLSHLNEKSFWDVIEEADFPVATHSNAYTLCPHPRNLRDGQITACVQKNSMIGITFVPAFTAPERRAAVKDLLSHVDYVLSLGGENSVGLGSDFDGITETIEHVSGFQDYHHITNALVKSYSAEVVHKILYQNFVNKIIF